MVDEVNVSENVQEVAEPVEVEVSEQQQELVNEPVQEENENVEVVDPQQEQRQVQSPEQNAQFAKIRREAESRARDQMISEMYGQTHGIHTYADYQAALQEQRAREEAEKLGVDPELYSRFNSLESELNTLRREKTFIQQEAELSKDPVKGNLYSQWKDDVHQIANNFDVDLKTAFTLILDERLGDILNQSTQKAQQDAIKKITSNGQSSPGSLGSENANPKQSISGMADKDFDEMMKRVARGEKIKL